MTLKIDSEFVTKAMQRAKARAADVAEHPHSRKLSANSREAIRKYQRENSVRSLERA
jgi:hypothetical protein